MKSLILWSSRTGNTKAIAEAVYEALPDEKDIFEEGRQPSVDGYDLIFVGFWASAAELTSLRAARSSRCMERRLPSSQPPAPIRIPRQPRDYLDNAAALLPEDSECLGTFISQGRVHSFHIGKRSEHAKLVHPMTPDRLARLQEAEKHPNEDDFRRAGEWAVSMAEKAQA